MRDVEPVLARFASQIRRPDYYQHTFTPQEIAVIREATAAMGEGEAGAAPAKPGGASSAGASPSPEAALAGAGEK